MIVGERKHTLHLTDDQVVYLNQAESYVRAVLREDKTAPAMLIALRAMLVHPVPMEEVIDIKNNLRDLISKVPGVAAIDTKRGTVHKTAPREKHDPKIKRVAQLDMSTEDLVVIAQCLSIVGALMIEQIDVARMGLAALHGQISNGKLKPDAMRSLQDRLSVMCKSNPEIMNLDQTPMKGYDL